MQAHIEELFHVQASLQGREFSLIADLVRSRQLLVRHAVLGRKLKDAIKLECGEYSISYDIKIIGVERYEFGEMERVLNNEDEHVEDGVDPEQGEEVEVYPRHPWAVRVSLQQ